MLTKSCALIIEFWSLCCNRCLCLVTDDKCEDTIRSKREMASCGLRGYPVDQLHIVRDRDRVRLKRTRFVVLFGAVSPNHVSQTGTQSLFTVWEALPVAGFAWDMGRIVRGALLLLFYIPIPKQFSIVSFRFYAFPRRKNVLCLCLLLP